jgi:hypothetical protein
MRFVKLAHFSRLVNGVGSWELGVGIWDLGFGRADACVPFIVSHLPPTLTIAPNSQLIQL